MSFHGRLSGLRSTIEGGEPFYLDWLAILFFALGQMAIIFVYTFGYILQPEFVRRLLYIQMSGVAGILCIMLLGLLERRRYNRGDVDRFLEGMIVGIVGIICIQAIFMVMPMQSDTTAFSDIFALSWFVPSEIEAGVRIIMQIGVATAEEFMFRGFLFVMIYKVIGFSGVKVIPVAKFMVASMISSAAFAGNHIFVYGIAGPGLMALIPVFITGMLFCFLFWRTRLLSVPIVVHWTNNTIAAIFSLLAMA